MLAQFNSLFEIVPHLYVRLDLAKLKRLLDFDLLGYNLRQSTKVKALTRLLSLRPSIHFIYNVPMLPLDAHA